MSYCGSSRGAVVNGGRRADVIAVGASVTPWGSGLRLAGARQRGEFAAQQPARGKLLA